MWQQIINNETLMLKRKIESVLAEWKADARKKPLIVKGPRQCGKTFSVQQFAKENYKYVVYINFFKDPDYASAFKGSLDVDDMVINISAMLRTDAFKPGETCIILDEIQECPEARTSLKFWKTDGRYDVICTGSLLGVHGYGSKGQNGDTRQPKSIPVGYETTIEMFPLDFEEFLWANGIDLNVIQKLKQCLEKEIPVPEAIHKTLRTLMLQYTVVGGMPEVVNIFLETHDMGKVLKEQRSIVNDYKDDMVKYAIDEDKPLIHQCFDSIPTQLSKDNKKFQYAVVKKGGRSSQFQGSLQWLIDAGIARKCNNLNLTELPLDGNAEESVFKLYMGDTGLFISMLEDGTQYDVLKGNLLTYKGAIFENLIGDIFGKMGRKLYYFHKDSGLEVDFVMRYKGECVLLEVKASSGNIKSTKTILKHPDKYHVFHAIKLGDYNIGRNDQILTLPLYMAFLLNQP